ncbi:response regulator [Vibrio parahaemolyticus]|nr:ATP-binding protein [Vibrio parahaemolyticus]EIK0844437.1 response regulator [Vibrio parahaemolyticus]EJQ8026415.1 response regulator [Vibrio parahaemolyticus]ELA9806408.1 response regulator [Vibrio parahaemolyticus]ELI5383307.1 response regulator [Vibrio parahaemolyticus]OOX51219.1 hybrid sensor histidine kinase/response regulator [Vibrio parahaemolyticus]
MLRLSIKTRLALLALLPAVVIVAFAIHQFYANSVRVDHLNQTVSNIQGFQLISQASHFIYSMEKDRRQYGQETPLSIEVDVQNNVVLSMHHKFSTNPHTSEYADDLKEAMLGMVSGDLTNTDEVGDWAFQLLQEMSLSLLQNYQLYGNSDGHAMQNFIAYLAQLSYWTQKEAWLTYRLVMDPDAKLNQSVFFQTIDRQQQNLDAFLHLGASYAHVDKLLGLFSSPRYQRNLESRARLMNGDMPRSDYAAYLDELDFRVQRLQMMIEGFTRQAEQSLLTQVKEQKRNVLLITCGVAVVLLLLGWLGVATWYRVNSKIGAIIHALNALVNEEEKEKKVAVDGSDEFTLFAQQVNRVVEEKQRQTHEILHAKESAVAANRAKSVFLANMSHEIRTPLNGIMGMTEILSQSELSPHQQEVVDDIDTSSHTLLALLNDILDLSKIESGRLELSLVEADIREVVYQSVILFQSKATSKQLELDISLDENIPARVMVDDHRIKQIITNLVSNAVKFTEQGYISVDVSYEEALEQGRGSLTFLIKDSGIGIERDKLATIFEPFTQEDEGVSRQFGGTGLGLAICRQLVSMMGGKLVATSTKGVGTCFGFSIEVEALPLFGWHSDVVKRGLFICDNYAYAEQIVQECRLAQIELVGVNSLSEAKALDEDFDVIFLCNDGQVDIDSCLSELAEVYDVRRVVVCQHHLTSSYTNAENVHAVLTQPFLGNRFKHAIEELAKLEKNTLRDNVTNIASRAESKISRTHRRILIAEDNLMNQKIASFFLDKAGYDYLITSNGQEALDAITKGEQFDAILMDCMMPVMDGLTATKEIRRWEKKVGCKKTTIIALTASVLEEDIHNCFAAGMDAYLPKPYKSNQLFELFNELKLA